MNKETLAGTGKVFAFTLKQVIKTKANIISFIIIALFLALAVPLMSLLTGDDIAESSDTASKIKTVFILNETSYQADVGNTGEFFSETAFKNADFAPENAADTLDTNEVMAYIHRNETSGNLLISVYLSRNSVLKTNDLTDLQNFLSKQLKEDRFKTLDVTQNQLDLLMSDFTTQVMSAAEYQTEETLDFGTRSSIQYAYSIVVMAISLFSVIYILRAVVEEKASKLVELLMVSVKPLALILGKVLAIMVYMFSMIIALALVFSLSNLVSSLFLDTPSIGALFASMGFDLAQLSISLGTVPVVLISLLLGYLTFSIIAGLAGAGCSSMEDIQSASTTVTFLILFGFLGANFVSALVGNAAAVASLIPIISVFAAPAHYIMGNINIGILCLSWGIQAVIIIITAIFCANVYRSLLMSSGSRIKLGQIIKLYRRKETL